MKRLFSSASIRRYSSDSNAANAANNTRRRWVEKISARVFCPHQDDGKGGNPITVFSTMDDDSSDDSDNQNGGSRPLSALVQQRLAQSCTGPSVMVYQRNHSSLHHHKCLSFYGPNGKETQLSAHAAMAGAIRVAEETEQKTILQYTVPPPVAKIEQDFPFIKKKEEMDGPVVKDEDELDDNDVSSQVSVTVHDDDIVTLYIQNALFTQQKLATIDDGYQQASLYRLLRSFCGLQLEKLPHQIGATQEESTGGLPTMMRVCLSFQRHQDDRNKNNTPHGEDDPQNVKEEFSKILVYVRDVPTLMETCQAPSLKTRRDRALFRRACDTLQATGVVVYTTHPEEDGTWLCRHFPQPPAEEDEEEAKTKSSGITVPSEDAASGMALATLAAAIQLGQHTEIHLPQYKFQQGQVMGQPSWIVVENIEVSRDYLLDEAVRKEEEQQKLENEQQEKQKNQKSTSNNPNMADIPIDDLEKQSQDSKSNSKTTTYDGVTVTEERPELDEVDAEDERIRRERFRVESDPLMHAIKARISFSIMGKIEIDDTQELEIEDYSQDDNDDDEEAVVAREMAR
ncbi:hypothetical protein ACA910_017369 [Epithemia clementina (nom. ined.)]